MTTTFADILALQKDLDNKLKTFGKEAFSEAFAQFFADNPRIDGITWHQYTPYFNDGDACTFGVGEVCLTSESLAAEFPDNVEEYMGDFALYEPWAQRNGDEEKNDVGRAYEAFNPIWGEIPEAVLESVFGDHVQVTIKSDGTIEVDDYDHD